MTTYPPGTVAAIGTAKTRAIFDGDVWHSADGDTWTRSASVVHPLVVLDPVNPALQVKTLREAGQIWLADQIEAQVKPPKPPEPQGLGAVVVANNGARFVRYKTAELAPWRAERPANEDRPYRYYKDLDVTEVLSEGVV